MRIQRKYYLRNPFKIHCILFHMLLDSIAESSRVQILEPKHMGVNPDLALTSGLL